jgi:uncharacterized membrane protein
MILTTSRTIDAPIDVVWALQLDHEHWPQHLPNFTKVERRAPAEPFDIGSSAAVTQPALGTVEWTVTQFDVAPSRRSFAWSGRAKGITFVGGHEVEERIGDRTQLTLTIEMTGGLSALFAPLARRAVQKSIEAEAEAFDRWARAVAQPSVG